VRLSKKPSCPGRRPSGISPQHAVIAEIPEVAIYGLPLAFESDAELDRVRGSMDAALVTILARRGLVALAMQHVGNGHVFSTRPRTGEAGSLEAFLGSRLWVPENAGGETFSSFGVRAPVRLAYNDVRKALDKGAIDTFVGTPSTVLLARWHTGVATVSREPIMRFVAPLVVHQPEFDKLSEADRAIARRILGEAFTSAARTSRAKDAEALRLLGRRDTIEFVDFVNAAEWNAWARSVADRLVADKKLPASLVQQLRLLTPSRS
jgi:TRAP-type C4-dicarboxylate transport system substrate-binding protein